ncbi:MAG: alpha/beta fold hydrolase [Pirellulaceae bacterium]
MLNPAPKIAFVESRDKYPLASRIWDVDHPVGEVLFLHGIVSHGGWYLSSCQHLAAQGLRVHFLERRGSGLNERERGHVDRWSVWLNDVEDYVSQLPERTPRLLLGISWGGILAAAFARRGSCRLDGLGLVCPGLFSTKKANFVQRTAVRLLHRAGVTRRYVAIPLRDPALFASSNKGQTYVRNDPLNLWKMTISFAAANLDLTQYATERPEEIHLPTLLMLAGNDPIVDPLRTRRFVERISHADRKIIAYPQASHTLEFELDPTPYFHDLAHWCRRIAEQSSGSKTGPNDGLTTAPLRTGSAVSR